MEKPLRIQQFRYGDDNLGYLVFGDEEGMAIDGGAVSDILDFAARKNVRIRYVANTHMHPDHTAGSQSLARQARAEYLDNAALLDQKQVELDGAVIKVYHTPGHTRDSLVFHWDRYLVTGDTLFNGTVGNCFSGDLNAFYESISLLLSFADETIVYAGHDYVVESMHYARSIEPGNADIGRYLEKYDPAHVFSILVDEKKVNPYLRFNSDELVAVLKKRGLATGTPFQRWESLMGLG